MQLRVVDRRRVRSEETQRALNLQLAHVCAQANMEALVLADESGLVLAGAGDPELCDELGAYAPLITRSDRHTRVEGPLADRPMAIRHVRHEGQQLFLVSCGEVCHQAFRHATDAWLGRTRRGVRRILEAA
jgi:hypothetical protein